MDDFTNPANIPFSPIFRYYLPILDYFFFYCCYSRRINLPLIVYWLLVADFRILRTICRICEIIREQDLSFAPVFFGLSIFICKFAARYNGIYVNQSVMLCLQEINNQIVKERQAIWNPCNLKQYNSHCPSLTLRC